MNALTGAPSVRTSLRAFRASPPAVRVASTLRLRRYLAGEAHRTGSKRRGWTAPRERDRGLRARASASDQSDHEYPGTSAGGYPPTRSGEVSDPTSRGSPDAAIWIGAGPGDFWRRAARSSSCYDEASSCRPRAGRHSFRSAAGLAWALGSFTRGVPATSSTTEIVGSESLGGDR